MDRITHNSPRQRGYGSTSSLRNDSLKHTRKHERRRRGIEPKKQSAQPLADRPARQGGPSAMSRADRPAGDRGLSAPCRGLFGLSRGPSVKNKQNQQGRTRTTDRPRGARGLSARHPRTVRPLLRTVRNSVQPKTKIATDQNERRPRTRGTRDEP
jgi:hypothetical protein